MNVLGAVERKATDFFARFFREMLKKQLEGLLQTGRSVRGFAERVKGLAIA